MEPGVVWIEVLRVGGVRIVSAGARNLITDVPGLLVGNASDEVLKSGVSVVTARAPFTAAVHVMGGAPGTRETDLLAPDKLVQKVDALVLSGGSAFGLDAAGGVAAALAAQGRGHAVGPHRVPIVPAAILFDLANGGAKDWSESPYPALGRRAFGVAAETFALGTAGAGAGAMTATLKGGLGSASCVLEGGHSVGALVAVNAVGSVVMGDGPAFWAAPFEIGAEFGGIGSGAFDPLAPVVVKGAPGSAKTDPFAPGTATTIAIVATDAALTQGEAHRMAVAAHDGLARAIVPAHTLLDGDLVFAVSTGARALADPVRDAVALGHAAAVCLSRAVARGVYEATPAPGDPKPTWRASYRR